jgi:hypothetical protein
LTSILSGGYRSTTPARLTSHGSRKQRNLTMGVHRTNHRRGRIWRMNTQKQLILVSALSIFLSLRNRIEAKSIEQRTDPRHHVKVKSFSDRGDEEEESIIPPPLLRAKVWVRSPPTNHGGESQLPHHRHRQRNRTHGTRGSLNAERKENTTERQS